MSAETIVSPHQLAEQRTREILHAQPYAQDLVVDSPPGAGKTGVVERLAVQAAWARGQRVMVATQTNAQAFDLARRLAENWTPNVILFTRAGLPVPFELQALDNLWHVTDAALFPDGPCVVVSNSRKWSYVRNVDDQSFDLLIVEEAYQLRDAEFVQIAGFAKQRVLVGDPGQIAPVTSCDVTRWSTMPDGPHVAAPAALLRRRPVSTLRMKLPVSRRLPADTVRVVQPAFYSDLPFQATSEPGDRQLLPGPPVGVPDEMDEMIDRSAAGATLLMGQMPDKITGEYDSELAQRIVDLIERLLARQTRVRDYEWKPESEREMSLGCDQIGVTCGHRSQVNAIQERLGALQRRLGDPRDGAPDLSQVLVETSDRFQGLERQVMIVHHPLAGRLTAQDFHLDAGRLCVMLSRHRVACFVFGRDGMTDRLERQQIPAQRVLGPIPDQLYEGNVRHRALLDLLAAEQRIIPLP